MKKKKIKRNPKIEFFYILTDLLSGKKKYLGTIKDISIHTGLGAGFVSQRIRPYAGAGTSEFKEYRVDYRIRNKGDEKLIEKPEKAEKIDLKTNHNYSIFIAEINGFHYYVTSEKQLEKSKFIWTTNGGHNYTIEHLTPTDDDYKLFDLDKEFQERILDWKHKPMYRGDIELVNQLIDDILIIKNRKKNIRNFGRDSIR
jgi:hypothetical protein